MKIVVLAGGKSTERNVSLSSGAKISNALRSKGHEVAYVDSFLGVDIKDDSQIDSLFTTEMEDESKLKIDDEILTDEKIEALRTDGTRGLFGKNVIKICQAADIVYMGLHGEDGENGKVQAVFDTQDIRYTGSGSLASGIAMDKKFSKEVFSANKINTAKYKATRTADIKLSDLDFGLPLVVKPVNGGSSVGTHIVKEESEFKSAIEDALGFDEEALIEEYVKGREFSVGVVDGHVYPAIEIIVEQGWYDFKNKFTDERTTRFVTPPELDDKRHNEMKDMAMETFQALDMVNYGRIDFLMDDNGIYVMEANSLPGMTPYSLLPQEAAAEGVSYEDLCETIVQSKMRWYDEREKG